MRTEDRDFVLGTGSEERDLGIWTNDQLELNGHIGCICGTSGCAWLKGHVRQSVDCKGNVNKYTEYMRQNEKRVQTNCTGSRPEIIKNYQ